MKAPLPAWMVDTPELRDRLNRFVKGDEGLNPSIYCGESIPLGPARARVDEETEQ